MSWTAELFHKNFSQTNGKSTTNVPCVLIIGLLFSLPAMLIHWLGATCGESGLHVNILVGREGQRVVCWSVVLPVGGDLSCAFLWSPQNLYVVYILSESYFACTSKKKTILPFCPVVPDICKLFLEELNRSLRILICLYIPIKMCSTNLNSKIMSL